MKKWIWKALPVLLLSLPAAAQEKKSAGTASATKGKALYRQYCISCHQEDGSGVPRLNPPLIKTDYVLGDKTRLIKVILQGLNEDVEINGEYYSNPMPPQAFLKDQEVADILTFVRSNFGNRASAVTVAEVKKVRAGIK